MGWVAWHGFIQKLHYIESMMIKNFQMVADTIKSAIAKPGLIRQPGEMSIPTETAVSSSVITGNLLAEICM